VALGKLGTLAVSAPALIHALQDRSVMVRDRAAKSLGGFYDTTVIAALTEALKDEDWHVRAAAAHSLGHWTGETPELALPLLDKLGTDEFALVRDRSAQALHLRDDERAVDGLVKSMVSTNRETIVHAVETIIYAKAVLALPRLKAYERFDNPRVREGVMQIYGALGGSDQVPAVCEGLNDPVAEVRLAAVIALRQIQERGASVNLHDRLKDNNPDVRAAAARGLGDLGDQSAVPRLVELLRDDKGFVRSAAAEALGKLGDRSAVPSLIRVLSGERPATETQAKDGLVIGTKSEVLPEVAKLKETEEKIKAVQALGALRAAEAVDPVIQYGLKAEDATLRAESAVTLGRIGEVRAAGPLQDAVREYYQSAPKATDETVIAGAVPDTVRQMREREARVRASVAWALGKLGAAEAVPILKQAVEDQNSLVRDAAAEALAKIHEQQDQAGVATP
jgi:HEAT repeat protein